MVNNLVAKQPGVHNKASAVGLLSQPSVARGRWRRNDGVCPICDSISTPTATNGPRGDPLGEMAPYSVVICAKHVNNCPRRCALARDARDRRISWLERDTPGHLPIVDIRVRTVSLWRFYFV